MVARYWWVGAVLAGLALIFLPAVAGHRRPAPALTKAEETAAGELRMKADGEARARQSEEADKKALAAVTRDEAAAADRKAGIIHRSFGCLVTANRLIAKMSSCGLNMNGITAESLCTKVDSDMIQYLSHRECSEIEAVLFSNP